MCRFRDAAKFDRCTEDLGRNCDAGKTFSRRPLGLVLSQLRFGNFINCSIFRALFIISDLAANFSHDLFPVLKSLTQLEVLSVLFPLQGVVSLFLAGLRKIEARNLVSRMVSL